MSEDILCDSCQKQKFKLIPRKSTVLAGTQLYMCKMCIDKHFEPRWTIIIAAQTKGVTPMLLDYIRNHRYIGETITAKEIL